MAIKKSLVEPITLPIKPPPKEGVVPLIEEESPTTVIEDGWEYSNIVWDVEGMPIDYVALSPEGERFTKSELDIAIIQQQDYSLLYEEYKRVGGELELESWLQLGAPLRPFEDLIVSVFPDISIEDFTEYVTTDFDNFIADMSGYTEEKAELLKQLGYNKSEIDSFYGQIPIQATGGIPLFDDWVTEKGFSAEVFAGDLRERGIVEELIPEMVEFSMSELRAIYEYEHDLGRWGTALGELDKIFISEPGRIPEVAKVFGQSLLKLPLQLAAGVLTVVGQGGAGVIDRDWRDRIIEEGQKDLDKFVRDIVEQYPNSQLMLELSRLSQNLAFSVISMTAGLAVGVPIALAPIPGARIAAYGAGTAASGFVAYQMTTYQIMQQYLELKDAEKRTEFGIGLTQFEEDKLKKDFHNLAVQYGLWEAIPEAISNLAFFSILTAPLTSMIGRIAAIQILSKIAGIYGEELLTETITQVGQAKIEVKAGLREEDISLIEAFWEIAPQTFLLTTVMAGAGQVVISSTQGIKKIKASLTKEIGTTHPRYEEFIGKIETDVEDLVKTEPVVEEVAEEVPVVGEIGEIQIPEAPEGEFVSSIVVGDVQRLTKEEFVEQNADLVVKEKGRWGTMHFALKTRKHNYQLGGQITSDSSSGVLELLYDRLQQVEVKPPAVTPVEPTVPAVEVPAVPEVTRAVPPARHEVPEFGEEGAIPPPTPPDVAKAGRRRVIEARLKRGEPVSDKLLAEFPDLQTRITGGFVSPTPKGNVEQALETGLRQAKKTGQNVYVFPTAEGMKLGKQPPPFKLQHYIAKPDGTYEFIEAPKPPAVEVAKPPVKKTIREEVESEVPPPDVEVPQGIADKVSGMKEVRAREQVRPFRKVMIRLNLWRKIFKPMQKAEVEMQEERAAFEKKLKEVAGWVGKKIERRARVFEELENPGTVKDLTFGEKRAVTWFREFFGEWADRLNLSEAKRIKGYITHIFEEQIRQQEDMSPEMALALEYTNPKRVFNKFIQERLGATAGLIVDPFVAAQAYESMELKVVYYEPMLQKIAGVIEDPNTPQSAKQYLRDYTRRMTGEVGKWDIALNKDIADFAEKIRGFPVFGEQLYQRLTRGNPAGMLAYNMTGGLYTIFLGFKFTSAIRNLSQHTLIIAKNGPRYFAEALAKTATAESRAALSKSLVMRSRQFAYTAGLDASFIGVMESKFGKMAMAMFRGADRINVRHAFLAGYYEAKAKLPNAAEQELIDYGDECAADTQYLYTKMNSMALAQNATGRTLSMLTTWTENWMELMATFVNKTPSPVFLEYEARTGEKVSQANWSASYKAIATYVIIVGLAMALDDETRIRLKEYTGIGSLKYLAGTLGGEFPALRTWGAIPKVAIGFALQDDRMFNDGMYEFKSFIPGIIKQIDNVASGKKDWMTLFFYVEGKDFKLKQLKEDWEKGWKEYEGLAPKERTQYRIDNPLIEAERFIAGKFTTLSSDEARDEVLRLIEKHNINPDLISGYAKIFGVDIKSELQKFQKRIGSLEKLEIGEEAEYFTTSNYVSEVNKLVDLHGRSAVMSTASPLTKFVLESQDTWGLFEDMTSEGKLLQRQQFPELEASLYLFGKIMAFENPNSAVELLRLMDKYDIPPEAIKAFVNDPAKYDELLTPIFELKRKWFELTTEYEALEEDERDAFKIEHPDWIKGIRRIEAYDKDIPETHHDDYVTYYTLPVEGYDQERFLKDNETYYNDVWLGILGNQEKDFDKIPTVKFEETLTEYEKLDLGRARYDFRGDNSWFDEEGVRLGRWKPYEKPTKEVLKKKEVELVEKIKRRRTTGEFAEREAEFDEELREIRGLLEGLK